MPAATSENPCNARQPSTASWCRKFCGPGVRRESISPTAQGWRSSTVRPETDLARSSVRQSPPTTGRCSSPNTASTMASSSASLPATWW